MIEWYILFLMVVLFYLRFIKEGYVSLSRELPAGFHKAVITNDLATLPSGDRLIYVIYKSNRGQETQTTIDEEIRKLPRYSEYKLVRVFPVIDESTATAVFYDFFNQPLRYDRVTVLTNNIQTTSSGNVRLIDFVNTDSDFYRAIQSVITNNNTV